MKRFFLIPLLLLATVASAGDFINFPNFPTRGQGPFDKGYWWESGLTFWAPFDDVTNPLKLNKGTGSLSFTRNTTATYVHPTTGLITTADNNVLRIESNGALIEGQRTNIATYSGSIIAPYWAQTKITFTADNTTAPDGTLTADRITVNDNGAHDEAIYRDITLDNNVTYTTSMYVKAGTATQATFNLAEGGLAYGAKVAVNLSAGTIGSITNIGGATGTTATISNANNGWYRISLSVPCRGATTYTQIDHLTPTDNNVYMYVWGAQLEVGAFPSSYIKTEAAAVTRNSDDLLAPVAGNFSATKNTIALWYTLNPVANNRYILKANTGDSPIVSEYGVFDGTGWKFLWSVSPFPAGEHKLSMMWDSTVPKMSGTHDAVAVQTGTFDGDMNFTQGYIHIGNHAGANYLFGHTRNLKSWYDRAFTDAELTLINQ